VARAIVHKTKGKLDLRSLTVFGMNAKPNTDTPIGYFGTGLKYAVAVLARNKIPVTFWIDRKQWVIEVDPTSFRGKEFSEIYICSTTIGGLIKKRIKLPFTTDLGKNWEIWQAFRELECNTRDEKGETFIWPHENASVQGHTCIVVEGEKYVNEYFNRNTHFLPGGMTKQDTTEAMEVFARRSNHIYYRGIRIFDLKEPSNNTYNFLRQIVLTEDRTAKHPFELELEIERYITNTTNREVVERAITAAPRTYERNISYDYSHRSELFLNMVSEAGSKATQFAQSALRRDRPPKVQEDGWLRILIGAITQGDYDKVEEVISKRKADVLRILGEAADRADAENKQLPDGMVGGDQQEAGSAGIVLEPELDGTHDVDDEIPF